MLDGTLSSFEGTDATEGADATDPQINKPEFGVALDAPKAASQIRSCMHIAQIAPLTESIPPKLYGGTERVVYWLTEELVALGHDVTLFASGDSHTSASLEAG